jgi:hypothetical protein
MTDTVCRWFIEDFDAKDLKGSKALLDDINRGAT